MPFCPSCGAEVKGAYCSRCGAPASPAPVATPGGLPAPRKTSPIVWLFTVIGGVILLGISVRPQRASISRAIRRRSWPGSSLPPNPDAEVVRVDKIGRQITIRDKRDGQEVTLSFDDVRHGRFSFTGTDSRAESGALNLARDRAGCLPGFLPIPA